MSEYKTVFLHGINLTIATDLIFFNEVNIELKNYLAAIGDLSKALNRDRTSFKDLFRYQIVFLKEISSLFFNRLKLLIIAPNIDLSLLKTNCSSFLSLFFFIN